MPDKNFLASLTVLVSASSDESFQIIKNGMVNGTKVLDASEFQEESLLATASRLMPDVIMISCEEMEEQSLQDLSKLTQSLLIPVLVFVQKDTNHHARDVVRLGASAFVVNGLTVTRIQSLIEVAIERFKLNTALHAELQKSKETLASRKTIEKAKGLLMASREMTEEDAYKALRNMAMRQGKPLREVSESMIVMLETLK